MSRASESGSCDCYAEALARGLALRDRGTPGRARHWLRRAYALASLSSEKTAVLAAWSSALRSARQFDEVLKLLERSIRIDPSRQTNVASYTTLVATLVDLDRLGRALSEAEELLREQPRNTHALNACGRLFSVLARKTGDTAMERRAAWCFATGRQLSDP